MPFGAPPEPKTIRNSRIYLGSLLLVSIGAWLIAPCCVIVALTELFPLSRLSFNRGIGALSWLCGAAIIAGMGRQMWVWARSMAQNRLLLDAAGAHFSFFSGVRGKPKEVSVAWHEIDSVTSRRDGNLMIYTVACQGGRRVVFTPLTFLRAKHVARLIAAGAGKTLTRVQG